jgi:replicative DNA helicase
MIKDKLPPQSSEIEEAIIGALMLDSGSLNIAMSRLSEDMFYKIDYKAIFKAIETLYDTNQAIDLITVVEELKRQNKLEVAGGTYGVVKTTNNVVSSANIENHILLLSEMYLKRQMIDIFHEGFSKSFEDETDIFDLISTTDDKMQKAQEKVVSGMSNDIEYYGMKVLEQHATVKETGVLGIKTGIHELDKATNGLVSPDLVIIAARPGAGKTALSLSITYNTSVLGNIPCAWFSLEMDGVQLVRRLTSMHTGIPHEKISNGKTTQEEDKMLGQAIDKISSSKIFIEDKTSMNIRDIRTRSSLLKKKYNIGYIIVDYIQLMNGVDAKGKNREQIVSDISRGLKCIAKELEIPVIALSQLSRAVESRPDKMPQLSDLRESGAIEQDADSVIFLMRPEYYSMTEPIEIGNQEFPVQKLAIASIAKNRHGSTKNIALEFTGDTMHFKNHHLNDRFLPSSAIPQGNWKPINLDLQND